MNSDSRIFCRSLESQSLPFTSTSYRESECMPSLPVNHERFVYFQGNSQMYKDTRKQQNPQQMTISHLHDITHSNSGHLYLQNGEVKNLDCAYQNRGNCKSLQHEIENTSDLGNSNQQNSFDSSGSLNFSESQLLEMRQLVRNIRHQTSSETKPHTNDGRSSYQGHPQERNASTTPSTGYLLQDRCTSRENFHLKKLDVNSEINNANTFHTGTRNGYLHPENEYSSAFSNHCLRDDFHFSQKYLPDNKIEHSAQQYNYNRQNSEKVYKAFNAQARLPRIAEPEQSKHTETSYLNHDSQLSDAYVGGNVWQGFSYGDNLNLANNSIKTPSFSNQYFLNVHLPMNQQSNKPIHSTQVYEENGKIPQEFSEKLNFQPCLPRFPDHRQSKHIQSPSKKQETQQSSKNIRGKLMYLRNNHTPDMKRNHKLKTTLNLPKNLNFELKDRHWVKTHSPDEKNVLFLKEHHLNVEKSYEEQTNKLKCYPSYEETNREFLPLTSFLRSNQKNWGNLSNTLCSNSLTQQHETISQCHVSEKGDKNVNVSANYSANIFHGYVPNSFAEEVNFGRNLNMNKNLKAGTPNLFSFAYLQCMNSSSKDQNEQIHPQINSIARLFKCEVCAKTFQAKCSLTLHMRTHTDERPFACNKCSRSFKYSSGLRYHIRTHTKEKPYKCNFCIKSFPQNSDLVRHIRTHTNERPFTCNMCSRSFKQRNNLVRHKRIHTNETPYECTVCHKSFKYSSTLMKHIQTHTK